MPRQVETALGSAIRAERTRRGVTQEAVGRALDVSGATVNRWETGQSEPDAAAYDKLFRWLGLNQHEAGLLILKTKLALVGLDVEVGRAWRHRSG